MARTPTSLGAPNSTRRCVSVSIGFAIALLHFNALTQTADTTADRFATDQFLLDTSAATSNYWGPKDLHQLDPRYKTHFLGISLAVGTGGTNFHITAALAFITPSTNQPPPDFPAVVVAEIRSELDSWDPDNVLGKAGTPPLTSEKDLYRKNEIPVLRHSIEKLGDSNLALFYEISLDASLRSKVTEIPPYILLFTAFEDDWITWTLLQKDNPALNDNPLSKTPLADSSSSNQVKRLPAAHGPNLSIRKDNNFILITSSSGSTNGTLEEADLARSPLQWRPLSVNASNAWHIRPEGSGRLFRLKSPLQAPRASGTVIGWGFNGDGRATGIPTPPPPFTNSPGFFMNGGDPFYDQKLPFSTGLVMVAGQPVTNAVAIAAANGHGLALRNDGTVVGWGFNKYGQATGIPSNNSTSGIVTVEGTVLSNVVALSAGYYDSLALLSDGTIVRWGGFPEPSPAIFTDRFGGFIAIAGGCEAGVILRRKGIPVGFSASDFSPYNFTHVIAIAASTTMSGRSLAVKDDGTVVQLYDYSYDPLSPASSLSNVIAVATGCGQALALKKDGTIYGWGKNCYGQATGIPNDIDPWISSGPVTIGGILLTNVIAISAAGSYRADERPIDHSLALRRDGTIVAFGHFSSGHPATVPAGLDHVIAIASGSEADANGNGNGFSLAITTNSAYWLRK